MTPPRPLRLGLLAWPVGRPTGVAAFGTRLEGWLDQARDQADLCMLPEYACVELGAALAGTVAPDAAADAAPDAAPTEGPDAAAELAAMVAQADAILAAMRQAAMRAGVWLLPGTLPMRAAGGRIINRAPLIAPDGNMAFQDKTAMTRFEAERWGVSAGAGPAVFDTPWGRIGISICYDIEFPKHARSQVEQGAWLVLAPSCTDSLRGYARVRVGAAARALENQCFVAVTPTVGAAPWSAALDDNHGQAAIFGPPDHGFPEDGVVAAGTMDQPGWLFATLDPALVEEVRANGAVRNHRDWPRRPVPTPKPAIFA